MAAAIDTLLKDLRSITGRAHSLAPGSDSAFSVDGLAPRAIARPGGYDETAAVLRYANEKRLAVIPRGGGSMIQAANVPLRYDIALDMSRLDEVIEHEPADLTVTCQAGATLGSLRKRLAGAGQMIPFDPTVPDTATAGGVLASAAYGPSRIAYGSPRDFTIGMKIAQPDGRLAKTGGKVVKNVAGYDLCKLYVGSLGTLGVIVEATFKVIPLPKTERETAFGFAAPAEACAFAAGVYRRGLCLRGAVLLNAAAATEAGRAAGSAYVLVLDMAGATAAVERATREASDLARALEAFALKDRKAEADGASVTAALAGRASALPSRLPDLIASIETIGRTPRVAADPVCGTVRAWWLDPEDADDTLARLRKAASRSGASLVVETCPPELKGSIDVFGEPPPSYPLMRRIKEQFDPNGILSPGRFLGKL